jgi:ligand-binding sensor domain-containing protein/two-component sensor histidine kinase
MGRVYKAIWLLAGVSSAEQLPIRVYTTADGLAGDTVNRIVRDDRGFIWLSTTEGLSRFDGYQFTNYGPAQGLPDANVGDFRKTRRGEFWVATRAGVCLFQPDAAKRSHPRFTAYTPSMDQWSQRVQSIVEDTDGSLWLATYRGMYRFFQDRAPPRFEFLDLPVPDIHPRVETALVDRGGALWVATRAGLFRRLPAGRIDRFTTRNGLPSEEIGALIEDSAGRLWVGTKAGLSRIDSDPPDASQALRIRTFTVRDGLIDSDIKVLFESSTGEIWIGTSSGLSELRGAGLDRPSGFLSYTTAQGLPHIEISALAEDLGGNVWVGTAGGGAARISRRGFVSYGPADGLAGQHIISIIETRRGELCVTDVQRPWIRRFDGRRFHSIRPNYQPTATYFGWGWNQAALQDHEGEWWLPSAAGLWRFPAVHDVEELAKVSPKAVYDRKAGLPGDEIFRVFEDRNGDVWMATQWMGHDTWLVRWQRSTGKILPYPETDGMATAFREDRAGNLWAGWYWGGLGRCRQGGKFRMFTGADGVPEGMINDLLLDRAGRLWIASQRGGLGRIDHPEAEQPRIRTLTTADGLSSDQVRCLTEDRWGRIYVGTGHGVDRLDPDAGAGLHIRHYTVADGLAPGVPMVAARDRHGDLWFGTIHGLSRVSPIADEPSIPPPVLITGLQVAGRDITISDLGEVLVSMPALTAAQTHLQFSFTGLGFVSGQNLLYQYRLDGVDTHWSEPSEQRSVHYAGLPPGDYRFRARAINAEGLPSATPAAVQFHIATPLWRTWWFQATGLFFIALAAHALYRFRLSNVLAMERVRINIATDLHDDIGSGLTRIGLLSELALRQLDEAGENAGGVLTRIAGLSRELGESMGDIVWSVNPARDRLQDLTQRMRHYAGESLGARDMALEFRAPEQDLDRRIPLEVRRQVFLIFKESINNVVRHSGGTQAMVELKLEERDLVLRVSDNGRGFRDSGEAQGNGLRSMERRARELGGSLEITSAERGGAAITARVPLGRRRPGWNKYLLKLVGILGYVPVYDGRRHPLQHDPSDDRRRRAGHP